MPVEIRETEPSLNGIARAHGFVLVVDDEEHNRTLLRDPLEARGYRVEEAENGMQALQKIAAQPPDVILLDLMMPKMDGFEVCRRLRKDPKTAHLPILMITALSERGDRLLGIQAGANDFLNKPVDVLDMILRVGNAVRVNQLHDQLEAEQAKADQLLLNILPKAIADRMKEGETNIADGHPDATVLVAELAGFSAMAAHIDPGQIVQLLNEVFSAFDALVEKHGLEKIKTSGDAYLVAGGITIPRPDHAEAIADLAIELREEVERINLQYDISLRLRIGICTGPVIAGVIGRKKFAYDIWGETVNVASRLEATGELGGIQIAEPTYERLKYKFHFENEHRVKTGEQTNPSAHWLVGRKEQA